MINRRNSLLTLLCCAEKNPILLQCQLVFELTDDIEINKKIN